MWVEGPPTQDVEGLGEAVLGLHRYRERPGRAGEPRRLGTVPSAPTSALARCIAVPSVVQNRGPDLASRPAAEV